MAIVPLNPTEENNEVSWYKAGAAGVASGILKVPEGIFSHLLFYLIYRL